jgi:hypothetical protein
VVVQLSGSALQGIANRLILPEKPLGPQDYDKPYATETWLAASGIDSKGQVSGRPIEGGETYTVATTAELLERTEDLPSLGGATAPRPIGPSLADLLVAQLKVEHNLASISTTAAAGFETKLRNEAEGRSPVGLVWRLNLRELSFQFSDTQVNNNSPFAEIPDARINAQSQVLTQGTLKMFSELYWNRLRWDAGVTSQYGRVTIYTPGGPNVTNTTQDQVVYETELRHRTWALTKQGIRPSLGPFFNLSYDTQWQRDNGLPKREFLRARSGLEVSDGQIVKKAYLGPTTESDFSTTPTRTHVGYAAGLTAETPIHGGPTKAMLDAWYIELWSNGADLPQDLRRRLEAKLSLSVPVIGALTINPFVDLYLFQGLAIPETGTNVLFGVSIAYSHLWKPFY